MSSGSLRCTRSISASMDAEGVCKPEAAATAVAARGRPSETAEANVGKEAVVLQKSSVDVDVVFHCTRAAMARSLAALRCCVFCWMSASTARQDSASYGFRNSIVMTSLAQGLDGHRSADWIDPIAMQEHALQISILAQCICDGGGIFTVQCIETQVDHCQMRIARQCTHQSAKGRTVQTVILQVQILLL